MVTEASNAVCGMDQKDGYITAVVKSRHLMPSFDTKQAFWAPFYDWNTANVVQEQPLPAFLFSPDAQFFVCIWIWVSNRLQMSKVWTDEGGVPYFVESFSLNFWNQHILMSIILYFHLDMLNFVSRCYRIQSTCKLKSVWLRCKYFKLWKVFYYYLIRLLVRMSLC